MLTGEEKAPRVTTPIPGPRARAIVAEDERWLATTTKTSPLAAEEARGAVVRDVDGNLLLDFTAGIGVVNAGHAHPRVVEAVKAQAERFLHFAGTDFYYDVQARLAQRLASIVPGGPAKKTFFANSGAEANEAAVKVARWHSPERKSLLAFFGAFHGRLGATNALSASRRVHRERFSPLFPGVHHALFPNPYRNPFGIDGYSEGDALVQACLSFLEDTLFAAVLPPSEVAACIVEPIQGEGGYVVPPKGWFPALKRVLDAHGILLVADEVQTGFGRTGKMFAIEHFGVTPQVMTLAKALGSGLPIGAAVFDAGLDFGVKGAHSNTYGGNPVAAAAALATLDVMRDEDLPGRAAKLGPVLREHLVAAAETTKGIGDVRGLGLMLAADFVKDRKSKAYDPATRDRVVEEAWKRGLILLPAGPSAIRFIPPLVVTEEQIGAGMAVFREALKAAGAR